MICKGCEVPLPSNWNKRRCAFIGKVFSPDNWNCGTVNALRDRVEVNAWSEDQNSALLPWSGQFIVLGWYKSRGRTEFCGLLSETEVRPLTLAEAELYLTGESPKY